LAQLIKSTFIPGYVENWIIVLDTGNLGAMGFPFKAARQMGAVLQNIFVCTLHKMYIVNPSSTFGALFTMAKPMIHEDSQSKIIVLKKREQSKMLADINPDQIPKEYGGTLELPEQLWPVPNTLSPDSLPINEPQALEENNTPSSTISNTLSIPEIPSTETSDKVHTPEEFEELNKGANHEKMALLERNIKISMFDGRKQHESAVSIKSKTKIYKVQPEEGHPESRDLRASTSHYGKYPINNPNKKEKRKVIYMNFCGCCV
jgi:hypothetical protein